MTTIALPHACEAMVRAVLGEDPLIIYSAPFREYGIPYPDGGSSYQILSYDPFCGAKLPSSLRHQWYERIEALGFEDGDPRIPERFESDAWWREEGL